MEAIINWQAARAVWHLRYDHVEARATSTCRNPLHDTRAHSACLACLWHIIAASFHGFIQQRLLSHVKEYGVKVVRVSRIYYLRRL